MGFNLSLHLAFEFGFGTLKSGLGITWYFGFGITWLCNTGPLNYVWFILGSLFEW